jgi:FAD/FMN-containing dehydrogenase/Fe-S oxidoreductase
MQIEDLHLLADQLQGDVYDSDLWRSMYATDGSIYKKRPLAVVLPRNVADIKRCMDFARERGLGIIPRTAGTSLAGQCVGEGIVVDVSRYMNKILEVDTAAGWVRVEPGVIRDELNYHLRQTGWWFGPNTSTASRCMLGGMVGNNSSGSTSIKYGVTRDKVMSVEVVLSDGSTAVFGAMPPAVFHEKRQGDSLESRIYQQLWEELSQPEVQEEIRREYPKPGIHRRNTGYAVDVLLNSNVFSPEGPDINVASLLAGSEGTLAFTTAIQLRLDPQPPAAEVLLCAHFSSLDEAMEATLTAMQRAPFACELMDKFILDCTKENIEQRKNRFFIEGDPAAILIIEQRAATLAEARQLAEATIDDLRRAGYGYAFPLLQAPDTQRVWALRAAGFGVLSNVKGDRKPVEFVEDTAVDLADLPAYIREFSELMASYRQQTVYYAHAGAGELHLRPSINLKSSEGVRELRAIGEASARLVKKYGGSLSGEHGDGRVRAEFIPLVLGEKNYALLRRIKGAWDPYGLLNPGKIVDAPPMDEDLRYEQDKPAPVFDTAFDYSATGGLLRTVEKCTGSGDCRKLTFSGGTMCPSYQATRLEKDSTRGRANALREMLTLSTQANPFEQPALREAMDLCLSCKGCTAECPSNVDMATLKAEYLYQRNKAEGVSLRSRAFASIGKINAWASRLPAFSNWVLGSPATAGLLKRGLGVAAARSLPKLSAEPWTSWWRREGRRQQEKLRAKGEVWFFCDEFTQYNDAHIGIAAVKLLNKLGYKVNYAVHAHSGRAHISKGLLEEARTMAAENVQLFTRLGVCADQPLVGVEPSAVLGFRDEYPRLLRDDAQQAARALAPQVLLLDEFLQREAAAGRIGPDDFTREKRRLVLHGHCHQKALSGLSATAFVLNLPANYAVEILSTGCCGMAGSFGYEEDHYELSMQIGELALFPAVRQQDTDTVIVASGTSCRHQIADGTGRSAFHPIEILCQAVV